MRPDLNRAKSEFLKVNVGVSEVGHLIGGKVDYNINSLTRAQGRFENACAIRMSYVLNNTGTKIPRIPSQTVSGKNGNWYIFKVKTLIQFLTQQWGQPDISIESPSAEKLSHFKGVVVFEVEGWTDASGHATLWDGVN
ncbi:type VI secretion system amidase effector protein Tae4 [Sessilibacter corallicola]|uniref:Type VI secretion system amidase effector protein Tae4 n=1 Tax=Sessilibacter corallicola TaxID=2904075 RepID=A0ABQ0AAG3_9GAMM